MIEQTQLLGHRVLHGIARGQFYHFLGLCWNARQNICRYTVLFGFSVKSFKWQAREQNAYHNFLQCPWKSTSILYAINWFKAIKFFILSAPLIQEEVINFLYIALLKPSSLTKALYTIYYGVCLRLGYTTWRSARWCCVTFSGWQLTWLTETTIIMWVLIILAHTEPIKVVLWCWRILYTHINALTTRR